MSPSSFPPAATSSTVFPCCSQQVASARAGVVTTPLRLRGKLGVPTSTARPLQGGRRTPCPQPRSPRSGRAQPAASPRGRPPGRGDARSRARRQRQRSAAPAPRAATACPSGCSDALARPRGMPASLRRIPSRAASGTTSVTSGSPAVSVPVLSKMIACSRPDRLQRRRLADQDAALRAQARADHHRRRRRQPQRAGAGDHEHRDRVDHRALEVRCGRANSQPRSVSRAMTMIAGTKYAAMQVRQALDRRLGALRLLHQPHDLLQHRVLARRAWRGSGSCRCG